MFLFGEDNKAKELGGDFAGEFRLVQETDGRFRLVQTKAVTTQDAPDPPGRVMMEEEVFATWAATALILAVMGTQFSSRSGVKDTVRIQLDVFTMALALIVLLWAALSFFGIIPHQFRAVILAGCILAICALIILVIVLAAKKQI